MTIKKIEQELFKLDARARARIAERLLHSLDERSKDENEKLWAEEALRRDEELTSGKTKTRPSRTVFREARARLK